MPMLPYLRSYLLDNWPDLRLGGPRPHDLSFLLQGTGVGKVCCYVFADDAAQPRWIAKMPRSPRDNAALAREYELIQTLRDRGSAFVRATIPNPLLTTQLAGHLVVVEPCFPGRSMDGLLPTGKRCTASEVAAHLDPVVRWLLRCQQETLVQRGRLSDGQIRTYLTDPIRRLQTTAWLTDGEQEYLDRLAERSAELTRVPLPLVFAHGDLGPGNVLLDGASMLVIDWEFGERAALPLMDVFSLVARTYACCHGLEEIDGYLEDYLAAFEAVFLEDGPFTALTTRYVGLACQALGVDSAWVSVLFGLYLVTEANRYYEFLVRRAETGYVYLLRSRGEQVGGSYADQLARQKYVWLLGHLVRQEARAIFGRLGDTRTPTGQWRGVEGTCRRPPANQRPWLSTPA